MASRNPDSLDNQDQFHARVPPTQTQGGKWHKPGNEQGNEAAPEFRAETYPPGTAPEANTFRPDTSAAVPGQANNPDMDAEARTSALDDHPGATSQSVHNAHGFMEGRPMHGQTSLETRGAHPGRNKKERSGLEGVGASEGRETVEGVVRDKAADRPEAAKGERGQTGSKEGGLAWPGAEEMEPTRADQI